MITLPVHRSQGQRPAAGASITVAGVDRAIAGARPRSVDRYETEPHPVPFADGVDRGFRRRCVHRAFRYHAPSLAAGRRVVAGWRAAYGVYLTVIALRLTAAELTGHAMLQPAFAIDGGALLAAAAPFIPLAASGGGWYRRCCCRPPATGCWRSPGMGVRVFWGHSAGALCSLRPVATGAAGGSTAWPGRCRGAMRVASVGLLVVLPIIGEGQPDHPGHGIHRRVVGDGVHRVAGTAVDDGPRSGCVSPRRTR